MDAEVLGTMRTARPVIEESGRVEDVHHLRLMALLHELVREKGNRGVAAAMRQGGQWRLAQFEERMCG